MFFLRRRRFYIGHQDRSLRTIFFYLIPYLFCVIMRAKCMVTDAEIRRSK